MKCSDCGRAVPASARFCHHCGAPVNSSPAPAAPGSDGARSTASEGAGKIRIHTDPRPKAHAGSLLLALVGGLAAAAGCFLPWIHFSYVSSTGIEDVEGVAVLVLGLAVSGLAIYALIARRLWLRILVALAGLGALAVGLWRLIDISRLAGEWRVSIVDFAGVGIFVSVLGALVAIGGAVSSLRRKK